jgi:hypothetical protein
MINISLAFRAYVEMSKMESIYDLRDDFSVACSWSPMWIETWYGLRLQLSLDAHAGLLYLHDCFQVILDPLHGY